MADHNAETAEWVVVAEDGRSSYTSEASARAAVTEGGWSLSGSPIVAALTRPAGGVLWEEVDTSTPPTSPTGADQ